MPRANASAGTLKKVSIKASAAPIPYNNQGAETPFINGSMTAAIALACGAASAPDEKLYVSFNIMITPPTVAAETSVPKNFQLSCLAGVLPSQYPIFKSVINPPAIESAVQTTPPMIKEATIPVDPFNPIATITTDAKMSVIKVIPETGFVPTIAMALAATVVKRNAIPATKIMAAMV